jgi:NADPH:quinone reductase-like Zn-dependent oxidoreductase
MKAAIYKQYGPPEVMQVVDLEMPKPKASELLVRVHGASVSRTDTGFRSAEYVVSRFWTGLIKPKCQVLGSDFSGVVEEIGTEVKHFKKGDKIFGFNDKTFGGYGEYLVINENAAISSAPANLPLVDCAAIAEGAHYALNNIRAAKVIEGQNVLVYGATGAIGSSAVQLLKYFGAHVTAVANSKNVDLLKLLGADEVIDYQTRDFTQTTTKFDLVFDAVGKTSIGACRKIMKEQSIYVSTELGKYGQNIWRALFAPLLGKKKVIFPMPVATKGDMVFLAKLVQEGRFKPVIDRYYALGQIVEAHRYVQSAQKTGNVILQIMPKD